MEPLEIYSEGDGIRIGRGQDGGWKGRWGQGWNRWTKRADESAAPSFPWRIEQRRDRGALVTGGRDQGGTGTREGQGA